MSARFHSPSPHLSLRPSPPCPPPSSSIPSSIRPTTTQSGTGNWTNPANRPSKSWSSAEKRNSSRRFPNRKSAAKADQSEIVFDEGKGLSTKEQQYDTTSIINEVRQYVGTWRNLPASQWQVTPEPAGTPRRRQPRRQPRNQPPRPQARHRRGKNHRHGHAHRLADGQRRPQAGQQAVHPWTMSDFSLMDAIECGIVKLMAIFIPGVCTHTRASGGFQKASRRELIPQKECFSIICRNYYPAMVEPRVSMPLWSSSIRTGATVVSFLRNCRRWHNAATLHRTPCSAWPSGKWKHGILVTRPRFCGLTLVQRRKS